MTSLKEVLAWVLGSPAKALIDPYTGCKGEDREKNED